MILTFDTEMQGFSKKFICGAVAYRNWRNEIECQIFDNKEETQNKIIEIAEKEHKQGHNTFAYAHNLQFDLSRIVDFTNPKIQIIHRSNPIIIGYGNKDENGNWEKPYLTYLDSMRLFQKGLEKTLERIDIGIKKEKLPEEIDKKLKQDNPIDWKPEEIRIIKHYCKIDTIGLLMAIEYLQNNLRSEGIHVKKLISIAQIAQNAYNKHVKTDQEWINATFEKAGNGRRDPGYIKPKYGKETREASRAGRFQAFRTGEIKNTNAIDANSLYPWAAIQMPYLNLNTEQKINNPLKDMTIEQILKQEGVTKCIIEKPKDEYGYVPVRFKQLKSDIYFGDADTWTIKRIAYPKQKCTLIGSWTNAELREYIKKGCKIKAIEYTINWATTKTSPLASFMKTMYEKRKTSPQNSYFYKQIMNNLTGRFSYQQNDEENEIENIDNTVEMEQKGFKPTTRDGFNKVFIKTKGKIDSHYYAPILSTQIYAYARIKMQQTIEQIKPENLHYMANDGIIFSGEKPKGIKIGDGLGEFKYVLDNDGTEMKNKEALIYGIDNLLQGKTIKLNGIYGQFKEEQDFRNGEIKYRKMLTLSTAPNMDKYGDFIDQKRDLKKTQKMANKDNERIAEQKLFKDMYTDVDWFIKEGYL